MASFQDRLLARAPHYQPPTSGEVQVFGLRVSNEPDLIPLAVEVLSEKELERAKRFVRPSARDEFIMGRAMLRCLTATALGICPKALDLGVNAYGKPAVDGIHCNLSHSHGLIYVALCHDGPVGIDVEWIDPSLEAIELANANFQPEEVRAISAQPSPFEQSRLFCALWTRKEAVAKCYGRGLAIEPKNIHVPMERAGPGWVLLATEDTQPALKVSFHVQSLSAPDGSMLAVAIEGDTCPHVFCWNLHE